ncbi:FlaA1/EpsC-like NDP-sugar epimerase [Dietzia kunjamensis]|uniref:polysaccharide biosynthesis protein n=1 Tax=Dietzia kunjamensis TaxID=322509 RepID=UPI000E761FA7|nr:nucleoside-diphosphate sugar epimerase/dehydratase [Dietzia kunjamensis]MBB1012566.1 polysaccharide biosynthesis protein [Dietzia kunjamensis]RKE59509.1 FlaA1/EpsC-like NDP-sugar epimerase [Dietzia kunjamensis]
MTRDAQAERFKGPFRRPIGLGTSQWIAVDAVLWAAMFVLALWMRFDFSVDRLAQSLRMGNAYLVLVALIVLTWIVGWLVGLYRGRFVPGSVLETSVVTFVFSAVTFMVFLGHIVGGNYEGVPRSTSIVTGAFTILGALVLRSLVRRKRLFGAGGKKDAERALVFGAGDGGLQLVRQLRRSEVTHFNPVGILDDDAGKRHMVIEGVRVHGGRESLEEVAKKTGASTLLLAVPSLPSDELIDIRDRAEAAGLHVLVLPPLDSMMKSRVAANELREINVQDLLGRSPARLNQTQIAEYLRGKRILVTGAGGSIGSELCRQIVRFRPAELMMLDRDESGLHSVQLSIHDQAMLDGDDTILASIRDRESIIDIFEARKPQIVFHAAALKHMPLLEHYPLEALKTNVLGTLNLLTAASMCGVETFVNISTDKAANPSSALGTSKRIAERLTAATAKENEAAKFVSVRFGNVLGSRGSVLTVFEKQIKDGGPLTVTDPEVDRFFMTIPEACQLVLQAAAVGSSGDTLVLDMGDPIRIADVAKTLIEQSGKQLEIVYTGLRENEKLSEELFDDTESPVISTKHESLSEVRVPPISMDMNEIVAISDHEQARNWLASHVYPSRETRLTESMR